jgi:hypothetical protein
MLVVEGKSLPVGRPREPDIPVREATMQIIPLLYFIFAVAVGPPADSAPAVKVIVDIREVPELAEWGKKASILVEKWHPIITRLLRSEGYTPPAEVRIVFRKNMRGVAYASGRTITVAGKWVKDNPDDFGMIVHELTHVVQGYRRGDPSWLVEGIADYIRFAHYEPKTRIEVNPKKASYRDGYRTTAKFLAWVEGEHDKDLVRHLNESLRAGRYSDDLFKQRTGKTLDRLWADFLAAEERK